MHQIYDDDGDDGTFWPHQMPVTRQTGGYQVGGYHQASGAEPFVPHQFEPKQTAISANSIPKLFLLPEVYADQLAIAKQSGHNEIGWLGGVKVLADYQFLIDRIFMFQQSVHGATTELTAEGLADVFTDLIGTDPELAQRIMFWGHVHPGNSTAPSGQDEDQMKFFNHNDWFIRGIFSRNGRAEFHFFDFKRGIVWRDIPWQIYAPITAERQEFWKKEIEDKVSTATVIIKPTNPATYTAARNDLFPISVQKAAFVHRHGQLPVDTDDVRVRRIINNQNRFPRLRDLVRDDNNAGAPANASGLSTPDEVSEFSEKTATPQETSRFTEGFHDE